MRKIVIFITIFILILMLYLFNSLLRKERGYVIQNDKGEKIKAHLFKKFNTKDGKKIEEVILYFDEIETSEGVLIFVPSEKLIGLPEGGKKSSFKIFSLWLYQTDKAELFTPINNLLEELVTDYSFSDSLIRFNTFWDLKKYGSQIFIVKN